MMSISECSRSDEDLFSSASKFQRTIIAKYYGRTLVERWHTQPMLQWIISEVKRLGSPKSETIFLSITDTSVKAVNVKFGRTVFEHKITSVMKFSQTSHDQKCFAYLTKESNDISLCHVFQASDEDSVYQLFSSLKESVQEASQTVLQSSSKALSTGESLKSCQCQHYEVLFVGKIKMSQKRGPPTFVDEAIDKFHASDAEVETLSIGASCSASDKVQNGHLDDQSASHPLTISVDQIKDPNIQNNKSRSPVTAHPLNATNIESPQSSLLSPPVHSLITHTQSLDAVGRAAVVKDVNACSFDPDQFASVIEDGSLHRQTSLPPINAKAYMATTLGIARLSIDSSASTPEEKTEFIRTMLFLIGSSEFCLISTDKKQTFFSKPFADISHCSQGIKHPEHFGIICREMNLTGMDVYIGYIFQGQSIQVVDEIMKTLKQAFHCALQKSQEKLLTAKCFTFCPTCPLYWFHKLCSDIEGLSPERVQATIMLRITSLPQREQKDMMNKFQDMFVHNQDEQNVVFMMLLRSLCEQKQMKHTHTIQKDAKADDTRKGGFDSLKSMAKKTFPSPFESIFKHTVSDAHTLTDIPKEMKLIKTHSLPASRSQKSGKHSATGALKKDMKNLQHHMSENLEIELEKEAEVNVEQKDKVAPLSKEPSPAPAIVKEPSPAPAKPVTTAIHPCGERSLSDTAALIWKLQQVGQEGNQSQGAAMFTSSELKINELSRSSVKTTMSPLRNIFLRVGSQSRGSSLKEIKEQQGGSQSISWRKMIFNRVQTPVEQNVAVGLSKVQKKEPSAEKLKRSSGSLKSLWKKAIMEQMILIRMERENKKLQMKQDRTFQKRIKIEYEEICPAPEDALQKWETILSNEQSVEYEVIEDVINYGVPRLKRGEIWFFLAEQHNLRNKSVFTDTTSYMEFLQKLTPYQHSILIDLGRTYPGHKYYSQALGPGQLSLFSILKAYSLMDEEVGYCQGLSFLAGALLLHMAEEKAFQLMKHIMFNLGFRSQYKPDMAALQVQMYQLARLIHDTIPDIHHHFESLDISPALYAAPWFLTLFASHFPIGFVARLLDMIFLQGLEAVFKVSVLLLRTHSAQILTCSTFESVIEFLKTTLPSSGHFGMEKVLEQVLKMDIKKQLHSYLVEYMVLKEEMSQGNAQIEPGRAKSLENDNKEFQRTNMELSEQLQVAQNSVKTLEASITAYQSTVRQLETRVRSLQDERDALHHSVNILRKRLENLESSEKRSSVTSLGNNESQHQDITNANDASNVTEPEDAPKPQNESEVPTAKEKDN